MKLTSEVLMVRSEPTAELSLADLRAASKLGIAIAAMIKIIATTISSSISEKPFCFVMCCFFLLEIGTYKGRASRLLPSHVRYHSVKAKFVALATQLTLHSQ